MKIKKIRHSRFCAPIDLANVLLFMIVAIPFTGSSIVYYVLIGLAIIVLVLSKQKLSLNREHMNEKIMTIPICFIAVWAIGVFNGLVKGNAIGNVFHNFIGNICYLSFFALVMTSINQRERVFRLLLLASKVATLLLLIAAIEIQNGFLHFWPANNIDYNFQTFSVTSVVEVMTFALLTYSIYDVFAEKNNSLINNLIWITLSVYIVLVKNERGGYLLAFLGVFAITICCIIYKYMGAGNKYYVTVMLITVISVIFTYEYLDKNSMLWAIFDPNDFGNSIRYQQFNQVFKRFKLLGNGLGTEYRYIDTVLGKMKTGYLIEISYLDLFDKYGILALLLIYSYYSTYKMIISRTINAGLPSKYASFSIGMMSYLFIGVGNPVIFAAYNVLMHCLVLYFLWDDKNGRDTGIQKT